MANDYSQYNPDTGFAGFNYNTEADILKRKQAIAQALLQQAMTPQKGQVIQSNMGTFYGGGNTALTALGQIAASALSAKAMRDDDQSQRNLDQTSNAALAYNLDPNNDPSVKKAVAAQQADEDASQLAREASRTSPPNSPNDNIDAGGGWSPATGSIPLQAAPQTPQSVAPSAQSSSAPAPTTARVAPAAMKKLAAALAAGPVDAPGYNPAKDSEAASMAMPNQGLPNAGDPSGSDVWSNLKRVGGMAKDNLAAALAGIQHFTGADGSQPSWMTSTPQGQAAAGMPPQAPQGSSATPQPQAPQNPTPTPSTPPMGTGMPPGSGPTPQPMPASQAQPQPAPQMQAQPPTAPQQYPYSGGDPRTMLQQAAANAQNAETPEDNIKQLLAIGQTGPMGQQMAMARLNQMFASKNGRFTTDVKPDSVNGGFVAVTTDSVTGQIKNIVPINPSAGTLITGQTTDANGNRLNIHKDGSTTPVLGANGQPVVDASVVKSNAEQAQKVADAVAKNKAAIGAIDSTLQRLDNIDAMSDQYGGPLNSVVPDKLATSGLRTYRGLIGQDVFSGVRDAVNAGGEGSPRFTQGEFSHFENNGGLNPDMKPDTVKELTAQQRQALLAKRDALVQYGQSLPASQVSNNPSIPVQSGLPPRQPGAPSQQLNYGQFTGAH